MSAPPRPTNPSTDPFVDCNNCGQKLKKDFIFCPACGQKVRADRLSIREMFDVVLNTVIGYDSKLWKTFKYIFSPGRLAQFYQTGQRKSLVHPIRLFFFLFVILSLLSNKAGGELQTGLVDGSGLSVTLGEDNRRILDIQGDERTTDPTKPKSFEKLMVFVSWDSICYEEVHIEDITKTRSIDDLYHKYNLEDSWGNVIARKQLKFIHDPVSFVQFILNSVIWMFLLSQPILAFFLKLIMRRKYYYSDHLVWSLYLHSSILFAVILMSILNACFGWCLNLDDYTMAEVLVFLIVPFTFLSVKHFYKKGIFATFGILMYILMIYSIVIISAFIVNILVGFLLF